MSKSHHVIRFMTNTKLTDRVKIENLRQITQLPPIISIIKSKVLKLFGHIKIMDHGVSKICLEGMINGKGNRGRLNKKWRDNIKAWTELNITALNTLQMSKIENCGSSYHMLVRILLQAETAINDDE